MAGELGPEIIETVVGRAEVKEVFPAGKKDKAAGLLVLEGIIRKGLHARLTREDVIVSKTTIASLRRFKDDVAEVRAGLECGVLLADTNDIKAGDTLEVFEVEERARTKLKQSELQENINAGNFATQKATQRLENLERFSSSLEQKIEQQKKVQQAAAAKPVVKAAPKPVPIIPVVLISIRNIAGTSYVSLRDGLDDSDLLMPGDTWRGWTLITADTATKSAIFTVAGKQQELRL
jgi:hypothetical protein